MYKTVVCHLLVVAIALQSLLAFAVAHPLHEQEPQHHAVSLAVAVTAALADTPPDDHSHLEHCAHFHFGCSVFAAGHSVTFDLEWSSLTWSDAVILFLSAPSPTLFRPPIV